MNEEVLAYWLTANGKLAARLVHKEEVDDFLDAQADTALTGWVTLTRLRGVGFSFSEIRGVPA